MVLGVVLHTCAAFSVSKYWLVSYIQPIAWVDYLNSIIHFFRMPLFFMISGFFAFLMMEKQSTRVFCFTKVLRIGIPFLSVLIVINLPQYALLDHLLKSNTSEFVNTNTLTGHLWFLVNLLSYFLVYAAAHSTLNVLTRFTNTMPSIISISLVIFLLPLCYLGLLALNKFGIPIYKDIPVLGSIHQLFAYFDYFLMGSFIARIKVQTFTDTLLSIKGMILLSVMLLVSSIFWWVPSIMNDITAPYLSHIQAILVSILIWLAAMYILSKNTGALRVLADASYTIYLFHHALIVALVLLANYVFVHYKIHLNAHLVFIFIMGTTLVITMAIHSLLVRKNKKLSFLFNGK